MGRRKLSHPVSGTAESTMKPIIPLIIAAGLALLVLGGCLSSSSGHSIPGQPHDPPDRWVTVLDADTGEPVAQVPLVYTFIHRPYLFVAPLQESYPPYISGADGRTFVPGDRGISVQRGSGWAVAAAKTYGIESVRKTAHVDLTGTSILYVQRIPTRTEAVAADLRRQEIWSQVEASDTLPAEVRGPISVAAMVENTFLPALPSSDLPKSTEPEPWKIIPGMNSLRRPRLMGEVGEKTITFNGQKYVISGVVSADVTLQSGEKMHVIQAFSVFPAAQFQFRMFHATPGVTDRTYFLQMFANGHPTMTYTVLSPSQPAP